MGFRFRRPLRKNRHPTNLPSPSRNRLPLGRPGERGTNAHRSMDSSLSGSRSVELSNRADDLRNRSNFFPGRKTQTRERLRKLQHLRRDVLRTYGWTGRLHLSLLREPRMGPSLARGNFFLFRRSRSPSRRRPAARPGSRFRFAHRTSRLSPVTGVLRTTHEYRF